MSSQPEISERELRLRSQAILDSVEQGESFTVTRGGRRIGELIPIPPRPTVVPRAEFLAGRSLAGALDSDRFRADLDAVVDGDVADPVRRPENVPAGTFRTAPPRLEPATAGCDGSAAVL